MNITYNIIQRGKFYEVWDSFADWIDTFDSEAEALACIAFLQSEP